jgi:L-ascorbate metabolism protein UlaG (beta-lactamase superfamily)
MKLTFLGHACFLLEEKGVALVFDPYLTNNPAAAERAENLKVNYVLVSHAHSDHLGDAVEIARRNNATVISTAEIARKVAAEGVASHGMHIGGRRAFEFGSVRVAPALHGSGVEGGMACGFVLDFFGRVFYFAGDTGLFGDMELLGKLESIDVALLPIGDNYTMGVNDAVLAARMLGARTVVPMHYNTWPLIAADPQDFKKKVEADGKATVVILAPGRDLVF